KVRHFWFGQDAQPFSNRPQISDFPTSDVSEPTRRPSGPLNPKEQRALVVRPVLNTPLAHRGDARPSLVERRVSTLGGPFAIQRPHGLDLEPMRRVAGDT